MTKDDVLRIGDRAYIRHPEESDCDEFVQLSKASRDFHRPWVFPPTRASDFQRFLDRVRLPQNRGFLVCRREDRAIVGVINISEIVLGAFQSGYMGYYVGRPFEGRGYMTEGINLVLGFVFRVLRLHRIEANIQPENLLSIALVKRCGFRKEGFSPRYLKIGGRWQDHERWAILRDEWPK